MLGFLKSISNILRKIKCCKLNMFQTFISNNLFLICLHCVCVTVLLKKTISNERDTYLVLRRVFVT